ncbi:MAG: hypothetical protein BM557_11095 [Flavobacterium sp. MedPE-SWcel]|nr:MAG: hypothetical protein BM557_11095 [Flavobacterium sp. MedPE-SWcel]
MNIKKWLIAYSVYLLTNWAIGIGLLCLHLFLLLKVYSIQLWIVLIIIQFVFSVKKLKIHFLIATLSTIVITFIVLYGLLDATRVDRLTVGVYWKYELLFEIILFYGVISIPFLILFQIIYIKTSKLLKK